MKYAAVRQRVGEWLDQPSPVVWPDYIYRRLRRVIALTCCAFVVIEITGAIGVGRSNPVWIGLVALTAALTAGACVYALIGPWPTFFGWVLVTALAEGALTVGTFYPSDPLVSLMTVVVLVLPGALISAELDRLTMRMHIVWVSVVLAVHVAIALAAADNFKESMLTVSLAAAVATVLFTISAMELVMRNVLVQAAKEHAYNAVHDQLTELLNRRGLWEQLPGLATTAAPDDRIFVALLDLDHFKQINDAHGHDAGDAVLVAVARSLEACSPRDAVVARLGGEEFAVVAVIAPNRSLSAIADDLLDAVRGDKAPLPVTISVGIATDSADALTIGLELNGLFGQADEAMYDAKRAGGDRFVISSGAASRRFTERHHAPSVSL